MNRIELTYSKPLVRRAVWAYWVKQIGLTLPIVTFGMIILGAYLLLSGDRSWILGVASVSALLAIAMMIALYVVNLKGSLKKFDALGKPRAVLVLEDKHFRIESEAGAAEVPWSSISEVSKYEEFWLLYFNNSAFVTIPTVGLSEEAVRSINAKLSDPRARVA